MLPQPSLTALADLPPLFSRYQRTVYCYYCYYHELPLVDIISSCPDTITLITVAKTLSIANPGCFPWISQTNIYSPNRKCPSDSPPSESSWVCDSPLFSSLQPQLRESVLQWVPKTRVSAPPPQGGAGWPGWQSGLFYSRRQNNWCVTVAILRQAHHNLPSYTHDPGHSTSTVAEFPNQRGSRPKSPPPPLLSPYALACCRSATLPNCCKKQVQERRGCRGIWSNLPGFSAWCLRIPVPVS